MQPNSSYSDLYALFDIMEIRGRYGDKVCAVTAKGKQYVRDLGNMTAERVKTAPEFANTRAAYGEFGAIAQLSATLRKGFGRMATDTSPQKHQHNKLTQKLVRAFKPLPGEKGQRTLPGAQIAAGLRDFGWAKNNTETNKYGYTTTTQEPITLKPRVHYHLYAQAKYPNWVTHIRPVCTIMAISDLKLSRKENQYKPTQNHHGETRTVYGPIISKEEIATAQRSITGSIRLDHHYPEAVEAGAALVTIIAYELLEITPEGIIQNQQYATMQTAWAGVASNHTPVEPRHVVAGINRCRRYAVAESAPLRACHIPPKTMRQITDLRSSGSSPQATSDTSAEQGGREPSLRIPVNQNPFRPNQPSRYAQNFITKSPTAHKI